MRSPLVQLLTTRRFAPLFVTQFLGAFNDNLLKSALAIFVTFRLAGDSGIDAATLVMIAGGLFIAPFFLFSGASGTLADRVDKAAIARWVKVAEIGIMALGAWGLARQSVPVLLAALFCLGTHSTVFGPIKYALLPQHLRDDELVAGNALIEAGTFLVDSARHHPRRQHRAGRRGRAGRGRRRHRVGGARPRRGADDPGRAAGGRRRPAAAAAVPRHGGGASPHHRPPRAAAAHPGALVVLAVRRHRRLGAPGARQGRAVRRRARGDADAGPLRRRCRPRIDARRTAAPRRGERALRARRGARDGVLRGRPALGQRRAGAAGLARRHARRSCRCRAACACSPISWAWRSPAGCSRCRSTPCCSTRARRITAPASSPRTTSSTRSP